MREIEELVRSSASDLGCALIASSIIISAALVFLALRLG